MLYFIPSRPNTASTSTKPRLCFQNADFQPQKPQSTQASSTDTLFYITNFTASQGQFPVRQFDKLTTLPQKCPAVLSPSIIPQPEPQPPPAARRKQPRLHQHSRRPHTSHSDFAAHLPRQKTPRKDGVSGGRRTWLIMKGWEGRVVKVRITSMMLDFSCEGRL